MTALVISVHPDDESLGCGGTLLKYGAHSERLFWLIMTQVNPPKWSTDSIEAKKREVERVAAAYEIDRCFKLGFPTATLDTVPQAEIMDGIKEVILETSPDTVFLVHGGDIHTDHQAVFSAAMAVLKPFHMSRLGVSRILSYETLSSTEAGPPWQRAPFTPTVFCDITPYIDQKIEVMGLYETEVQPDPFPRGPSSVRGLARYRGATIGVEYAEAFMLLRQLE